MIIFGILLFCTSLGGRFPNLEAQARDQARVDAQHRLQLQQQHLQMQQEDYQRQQQYEQKQYEQKQQQQQQRQQYEQQQREEYERQQYEQQHSMTEEEEREYHYQERQRQKREQELLKSARTGQSCSVSHTLLIQKASRLYETYRETFYFSYFFYFSRIILSDFREVFESVREGSGEEQEGHKKQNTITTKQNKNHKLPFGKQF